MSNQAAWLKEKGAQFEIGNAEKTAAGPDEVTIRGRAVAINPVDWKMQDLGRFIKQYPTILGCDVSGEITEVGSNVQKFKIGDRVIGHCPALLTGDTKNGAFQLFSTLPAKLVAKLPKAISFAEGSVLPLAISTAADGLYGSKDSGLLGIAHPTPEPRPDNGSILVVYGASSSVGAVTIQLAVASGVKVIGIASEKNFDFVRAAGAAEVFDYKDPQIVNKVVEAVKKSGRQLAGVYDAIALADQSYHITVPILDALGGGNLAAVLPPPESLPAGIKAGNAFALTEVPVSIWAEFVGPALEQGTLKPIPEPYVIGQGLESIQAGLVANKKGVSAKKVVVEL